MTEWLPLLTYCAVMSGTPGPNNVMLTANGARFGYRLTLPAILGILSGAGVQTAVTCAGLGTLLLQQPAAHGVLRIAGALYLMVLAARLAWAPVVPMGAGITGPAGDAQKAARPLGFWTAALFQAVNPKSWVKAVTLASVFMPAGWPAWQGALVVAGIGMAVGFPCISLWALFGVALRRLLAVPRRQRVFNALMGLALAGLALSFLR